MVAPQETEQEDNKGESKTKSQKMHSRSFSAPSSNEIEEKKTKSAGKQKTKINAEQERAEEDLMAQEGIKEADKKIWEKYKALAAGTYEEKKEDNQEETEEDTTNTQDEAALSEQDIKEEKNDNTAQDISAILERYKNAGTKKSPMNTRSVANPNTVKNMQNK